MDGIASKEGVIMLASTNRADVLDKVELWHKTLVTKCTESNTIEVSHLRHYFDPAGLIVTY